MAVADTPWVDGLTMGQVLRETARKFPTHDALVFPQTDRRWTWQQFDADVDRVARGLIALGMQHGEHLALWATNVPQWVLLQFATARIGVVLVNINPAYRPFELEYVLRQSDSVALMLVEKFKTSDYFAMLGEICPELAATSDGLIHCANFPKLRRVVALCDSPPATMLSWPGLLKLADSISAEQLHAREEATRCNQAINIQYTSGTTGFPKAAMLSHRNLLLNAYYVGNCQRMTEQDRLCIPVPFYHCFGCVLGTLACAVHGAAMIIPAEYFQPQATLEAMEKERATAVYGVPTMYIAQLQCPTLAGRDLTSLRTGIMSGSPCPIEVMKQVSDKFGVPDLTIAYGQTEASPVITQTRCDDDVALRVETVGRPLPGWDVKIVEPETGKTLPDNQQGELCARGHGVMLGYYNNPEATASAIDADGWLHTGDLAVRLPNGYYKITGRLKDLVIRGGENIYPREIEEFLFTHPAVEQAAVVGVPDPKYTEELCAWIKLRAGQTATEDEIRQYCRQKLAHYKTPRYVKFVEAFPQTVTGKIQKFRIREIMKEELGLKEQDMA
ncbi:Long-chain-fatty-acid--CoA ligase [Anatilimnocola aggregata]|uniref:Long-chain-fatty-acid--CoA ligase n=1 Tax=Anatilimnocola aggregata TaxID=2528021 RepID=A0A517YKY0_9BACT|nr:AMP-binding protein [Anatilimnocola aggregata]QDU30881.1 Long-chain-fatty-acid--CoA ligase [Anatilimnocola aggregata]